MGFLHSIAELLTVRLSELGDEKFIEDFKDLLVGKEQIKEIPRSQRHIGRPTLSELFKEKQNKAGRNKHIYAAHTRFGYTLKEIADYLRVHYTTVSKAIQEEEGEK